MTITFFPEGNPHVPPANQHSQGAEERPNCCNSSRCLGACPQRDEQSNQSSSSNNGISPPKKMDSNVVCHCFRWIVVFYLFLRVAIIAKRLEKRWYWVNHFGDNKQHGNALRKQNGGSTQLSSRTRHIWKTICKWIKVMGNATQL